MSNVTNKIAILIADDHALVREALRNIFRDNIEFQIVGEAKDGEEAVKLSIELNPKVVIMDISMPKLNGIEATRRIKEKKPEIIVLVLTVHDDDEHVISLLQAGAAGYLTKNTLGDEIVSAIHSIIMGDNVLSPDVTQRIIKRIIQNPPPIKMGPISITDNLTRRELEMLRLAATGLSNKEISNRMQLSIPTVKSYLSTIFDKLHASSRTEAVMKALRIGLITFEDF